MRGTGSVYMSPNLHVMRASTLFLLLFALSTAQAQQGGRGTIGGGIGLAIPTGEFEETWGRNMFTLNGHMGIPMGRLPFQAGFAFGYSSMGEHAQVVPLAMTNISATEADLKMRTKVLSYHPLLRFSPLRGKVRPYVDGMVGFRHFTTQSRVLVEGLESPVRTERHSSDLAFSTGWAAGIMFRLGRVAYVEARVERFDSGKATYVDPTSIMVNDLGHISYNTLSSNTDAVHALVGLGLSF